MTYIAPKVLSISPRPPGKLHAAFEVAGVGDVAMVETVNPTGNRKSLPGNPVPKVCASRPY